MIFTDSLAFLGKRGGPIVIERGFNLQLAHLTACPPWVDNMKDAISEIKKFKESIKQWPELEIITYGGEIESVIQKGKTAIVLGMQHLPDDADIRTLREEGIRIVSFAYYGENRFGSGWINAGIGLKKDGQKILRECSDYDIIVDVSHSGHQMARDILNFYMSYSFPVIASHGGCYNKYHHMRNLLDDILTGVAVRGGYIGISTLTFTNHETDNTCRPFFEHLEHAVNLCGDDVVGIGSDGLYITVDIEQYQQDFEKLKEKLDPQGLYGARIPENPFNRPFWMEIAYDYCERKDIKNKIFGQNFVNFLKKNLE